MQRAAAVPSRTVLTRITSSPECLARSNRSSGATTVRLEIDSVNHFGDEGTKAPGHGTGKLTQNVV
jgi:hypothetical protein